MRKYRSLASMVMLGFAVSVLLSATPGAKAAVNFDMSGTGTFNVGNLLFNLDWAPGNTLGRGAVTALNNFATSSGSVVFTDYYQAKLSLINYTGGGTALMPAGTELTIVAGIQEKVTALTGGIGANGTTASFAFVPGGANWLEIYYDNTAGTLATEANNLIGTGFNDGPGVSGGNGTRGLILSAAISAVPPSLFTINSANAGALDQTTGDSLPHDDYVGISTIGGDAQAVEVTATITAWDPKFFNFSPLGLGFINVEFLQSVGATDPFRTQDPSSGFVTAMNTTGLNTGGPAPDLTIGPDVITPANNTVGSLNGVSGPDIAFLTDTSSSFDQVQVGIPEPVTASLSLVGLSALGLAGLRRRKA